jgi:hypothetical protein
MATGLTVLAAVSAARTVWALAVAVFGALLSGQGDLVHGLRVSLLVAAAVALAERVFRGDN